MQMYVANATRQYLDFMYTMPEVKGARRQSIPPGGQVKITGDLNTPQIESIIRQHDKYGMRNVTEVDSAKGFVGYMFSLDRPVPAAKLQRLMDRNIGVLQADGKKFRTEAAIAEQQRLDTALQESGLPETLRTYETTIVEEVKPDRQESQGDPISEGVRVQNDAPVPRQRGRRARS